MRDLPRALEELLLHDLVPEVVDLLDLGEEAVAAEVEAVAVADLGAGDAADLSVDSSTITGLPCLASR